jgi:hypothetical protein
MDCKIFVKFRLYELVMFFLLKNNLLRFIRIWYEICLESSLIYLVNITYIHPIYC